MTTLYSWEECAEFDIKTIHQMYSSYVNKSQVDLIGSFGFGKTTVDHAEGMYLYTSDDRKILDFTGGIGVLSHGHNHPDILAARRKFQEQKKVLQEFYPSKIFHYGCYSTHIQN